MLGAGREGSTAGGSRHWEPCCVTKRQKGVENQARHFLEKIIPNTVVHYALFPVSMHLIYLNKKGWFFFFHFKGICTNY